MAYLIVTKPDASEHDPYFSRYINLVHREDVIRVLSMQVDDTLTLLRDIPDSRGDYRYASDKWSVKEVVGHVIDSERVFAYRALTFARNDRVSLPGFEQDDWIRGGSYAAQSLKELASEFECVRRSNIYLFQHLDGEAWMRRGKANNAEVSVRALAYIIAGHELHHRKQLEEKYLRS